MKLSFDVKVAGAVGLNEAIFIDWLAQGYDQSPTTMEKLLNTFNFWTEEVLYQCLAGLESRKLIQVQRTPNDHCIFSVNHSQLKVQFDLDLGAQSTISNSVVTDTNLKKHLLRFQNSESLLNKKLTQLIQQNTQELLDYAMSEGLSPEMASASLDKFLHYVAAHPDKYWNTDLISYWRFWVSNSKEKQQSSGTKGKRSAIEQSNDYAASNWLKKKMQSDSPLHTPVQVSHQAPDTKKPT